MKIFFIILFFSYLPSVNAQENESEYKKLIDSAISLKIKNIIEFSRNVEQKNALLNKIYLIDENELRYLYSSTNYDIEFKSISIKSSGSKNILKKGINAWKIFPVLKNNRLIVTIIYFKISYKNNLCYYSKNGGTQVTFEYSCEEKKWIQIEFKNSRD